MNNRILKLIESRLELGQKKYGHENVENDGRNFTIEALEEILDCCVYIAAKLIETEEQVTFQESKDSTIHDHQGFCLDCKGFFMIHHCKEKG